MDGQEERRMGVRECGEVREDEGGVEGVRKRSDWSS